MNWIMIGFVLAALLIYGIYSFTNPKNVKTAFNSTFYQLFSFEDGFIYIIIASFLISSMLILILPKEQIAKWIGPDSGIKGISIGTGIGVITPGGPILTFPLLVAFYKAGAGAGVIIAYLSAWSLFGLQRVLTWEVPFLGAKFVAVRIAISFMIPFILGILGQWIYNRFV